MAKRTRREVRHAILTALADGKQHSYGNIERKASTNWQTVRDHCEELHEFGLVRKTEEGIQITKRGLDHLAG